MSMNEQMKNQFPRTFEVLSRSNLSPIQKQALVECLIEKDGEGMVDYLVGQQLASRHIGEIYEALNIDLCQKFRVDMVSSAA